MGLDMYLNASRYLWSYPEDGEDAKISKSIQNMFPELDLLKDEDRERNKVRVVQAEIGYWRKANAIHNWFVKNVQDGEDNCRSYFVGWEDLEKLRAIVEEVLADTTKAPQLLPTADGFFFGTTAYNDWYWRDVEYTKDLLDKLISNREKFRGWDIEYRASW